MSNEVIGAFFTLVSFVMFIAGYCLGYHSAMEYAIKRLREEFGVKE